MDRQVLPCGWCGKKTNVMCPTCNTPFCSTDCSMKCYESRKISEHMKCMMESEDVGAIIGIDDKDIVFAGKEVREAILKEIQEIGVKKGKSFPPEDEFKQIAFGYVETSFPVKRVYVRPGMLIFAISHKAAPTNPKSFTSAISKIATRKDMVSKMSEARTKGSRYVDEYKYFGQYIPAIVNFGKSS